MDMTPGYHKVQLSENLLVLETEDWSKEEWKVLCKMSGVPFDKAERMVLHVKEIEYFLKGDENQKDETSVSELCPHCENEVTFDWNIAKRGYVAFCPICGNRLLLCDSCVHEEIGGCDYNKDCDACRQTTNGKSAKWINRGGITICSNCGKIRERKSLPYCPRCKAKMDGKGGENNG